MVETGYVWWSKEWTTDGVVIRENYWDIKKTPAFVWFTLIVAGYAASSLKRHSLGYYGMIEVCVGLLGGFVAISGLSFNHTQAWLALIGSAFFIVRGAGNVQVGIQALESENTEASKCQQSPPQTGIL
jgi:hypothetical protein